MNHMAHTPGRDLFPAHEAPSAAHAERGVTQGPTQVLLCHDHPALGYRLKGLPIPGTDEQTSAQVRSRQLARCSAHRGCGRVKWVLAVKWSQRRKCCGESACGGFVSSDGQVCDIHATSHNAALSVSTVG